MSQNPFVLARIKTPDKRKGFLVRRYTYQGKRFDCDNGWHKVGRAMGAELAQLTNPANGSAIFDVVELEEAKGIDEKEKGEEWSRGARPAEHAPAVKVKDFRRRQEIKEEVAVREGADLTESDWDDVFDPQKDLDGSDDDLGPDEAKPAPEADTEPKETKKRSSSRRRSQTK